MGDGTYKGAGEVFATRLRQVRALHGMTARELSERLTELGAPMSRSAIAKLETEPARAANVRLENVLAIAAALNVSPMWMITPEDQSEYVCVAPSLCQPAGAVRQWMRGDWPLGGDDPDGFFMMMPPAEHEYMRRRGQMRRTKDAEARLPAPFHYAAKGKEGKR